MKNFKIFNPSYPQMVGLSNDLILLKWAFHDTNFKSELNSDCYNWKDKILQLWLGSQN